MKPPSKAGGPHGREPGDPHRSVTNRTDAESTTAALPAKPPTWRLDTDGSTVRLVGPRGELVLLALECINPVDGDLDRLLRRLVVVGEQYRIAEVELRGLTIAVANLLVGNRGSA